MNLPLESPELRPALPTDLPFLRELFAVLHRPDFAVLNWPEPQLQQLLDLQFDAQHASYCARFPDGSHQIVMREAQAVGRLWINAAPDEIRLVDIALLPAHQNLGIGTALVRALMEQATSQRPLRLSVALSNARAQRWYHRLGFQLVARDDVYQQMQWPASPQLRRVADD